MAYHGYLDGENGWNTWGWAFDDRRPTEPVDVEYTLSTGESGTVAASDFRDDLLRHDIGDGRHAFNVPLPVFPTWPEGLSVSARIKGSDFRLNGAPLAVKRPAAVGLVAGDIVNNCNLRCPFCIVDYSSVRGLKLMTEETFRRMFDLMADVPPGQFWLSCLHEPTMHPRFVEFIEMVPEPLRNRISFTTNLARRFPAGYLQRLVATGVHSIRVSFDSRDPALFAELRKGAKYEIFEANVKELAAVLPRSGPRPQVRYITMAFQENWRDIAGLVEHCRDHLRGDSHEVRFMYYLPHLAHWGHEHMLSRGEWAELEAMLEPLKATTNIEISGPYPGMREQFEAEQGLAEYVAQENSFGGADDAMAAPLPEVPVVAPHLADDLIRLRMRWDGLLGIDGCPEDLFRANVKRIERPADYFYQLRAAAKLAQRSRSAPQTAAA
ncbi:MAG TPA: radical SAM protein [Opitutaceae bacterium]|nr:radical SAM protein [Opitutaceae bacterium]